MKSNEILVYNLLGILGLAFCIPVCYIFFENIFGEVIPFYYFNIFRPLFALLVFYRAYKEIAIKKVSSKMWALPIVLNAAPFILIYCIY